MLDDPRSSELAFECILHCERMNLCLEEYICSLGSSCLVQYVWVSNKEFILPFFQSLVDALFKMREKLR